MSIAKNVTNTRNSVSDALLGAVGNPSFNAGGKTFAVGLSRNYERQEHQEAPSIQEK